jgi:hypothetical protein
MVGFRVIYRNYGHWDIYQKDERIYRIRGGPGKYCVIGEYSKESDQDNHFKTVQACMSYICDTLMFELIVAEGQDFEIIESWNIGGDDMDEIVSSKMPTVLIDEDMDDYYAFRVYLYGKVNEGTNVDDVYPIYKTRATNDDCNRRGKFGETHTWTLWKAHHLCSQLNIPVSRIFIKYLKGSKYRRLNKSEIKCYEEQTTYGH